MPVYLVLDGKGHFDSAHRKIDCSKYPCPTITAGGVGPVNRSSYWLEFTTMPEQPQQTDDEEKE